MAKVKIPKEPKYYINNDFEMFLLKEANLKIEDRKYKTLVEVLNRNNENESFRIEIRIFIENFEYEIDGREIKITNEAENDITEYTGFIFNKSNKYIDFEAYTFETRMK